MEISTGLFSRVSLGATEGIGVICSPGCIGVFARVMKPGCCIDARFIPWLSLGDVRECLGNLVSKEGTWSALPIDCSRLEALDEILIMGVVSGCEGSHVSALET